MELEIINYVSLIIAILAIFISVWTTLAQIRHNRLSLMPICEVFTANFNNYIAVEIKNKGLGFMQIEDIYFVNNDGFRCSNLYDFFNYFIKDKTGLSYMRIDRKEVIMPGEKMFFIKLESLNDTRRIEVIKLIENITVHIKYSDAYRHKYYFSKPIKFV